MPLDYIVSAQLAFQGIHLTISHYVLKPIGHRSKTHLSKVVFCLLLTQLLCKWVYHVVRGVYSSHLDVLLLQVIMYYIKSPLDVLGFLVRPGLLSKSYSTIIIAEKVDSI